LLPLSVINYGKTSITSAMHIPASMSTAKVQDTVQFVSKHLGTSDIPVYSNARQRAWYISEWLKEYHSKDVENSRKKYLRDCVVLNVWYLFPYVLSGQRFKSQVFDDTLQGLVLNVIKAIDNFDTTRGIKFTDYIKGYIKDAISSSFRGGMIVKVPATVRTPQIMYLKCSVPTEEQQIVTEDPLPETETEAPQCKNLNLDTDLTINDIKSDIVYKNLPDSLSDKNIETDLINKEYLQILRRAIATQGILTDKEKKVLNFRFGLTSDETKTLQQVADIFKADGGRATKERVFQIEAQAKKKIKLFFKRYGVTGM